MSGEGFKILKLRRPADGLLSSSNYLAEFEAIVIKPEWSRLVLFSGPDMATIVQSEAEFGRKSSELRDFLEAGGLLVVLVVPREERHLQSSYSNPHDNIVWWAIHLTYPWTDPDVVAPGAGTSVIPTGAGSEFDAYLNAVQHYDARLGSWFEDRSGVNILARNRAGGPVAAEVAVGNGTVVCVPPPTDHDEEELLFKAIEDFLGHRFGPGLKWPVAEEEELRSTRDRLIADFHLRIGEVETEQRAVQDRKRAVFEKSQVRRAVGYFDQAIRPGRTPKQTLDSLYSLIEMLKDYYETGWDGLAGKLGVSRNSVGRIKTLANKKELHLRHTTADDPEGVEQSDLDRIVADARAIVSAFIAQEYASAGVLNDGPS